MTDEKPLVLKGNIGAQGGSLELSVGSSLPDILHKLLPDYARKQSARTAITSTLISKFSRGERLTPPDLEYLSQVLGEQEAKWINRTQILQRAKQLAEAAPKALPPGPTHDGRDAHKATAQDWISRFWDDAGVVSDEVLQELYARLLSTEARAPGTCSMRALKVIKYLDREIADTFGMVAPYVLAQSMLPRAPQLLEGLGINHQMLLDLEDAGLLQLREDTGRDIGNTPSYLPCAGNVIRFEQKEPGDPPVANDESRLLPIYPLTRAGMELFAVADAPADERYFDSLCNWLTRRLYLYKLSWAPGPAEGVDFDAGAVTWTPVARS